MQNYKELILWQEAHNLTLKVYEVSKSFPKEEIFGITSQIRRAFSSIPCNIAEGCGKYTAKDFANFLQIALGSEMKRIIYCSYLKI
jgi:four helix bundle protein